MPKVITNQIEKKVKSAYEPVEAHQAGAYPGFLSMKQLEVNISTPPWMGC